MNEKQQQQQPPAKGELVLAERQIEFVPFGGDQKLKITIKMVQEFIATKTKAGHTCSARDAMRFLMLCQARGLNPWEGDAFLIGYDTREDGPVFNIVTSHQAFLKRAEVNPDYDGMESGVVIRTEDGRLEEHQGDFVDDNETLLGGWAKVHFKNRKYPIYRKLHIACFKPEFPSPLWKKNSAGMICKTAEADALRSAFPTKCAGMYLQQETDTAGTLGEPQGLKQMPAEAQHAMLSANNGSTHAFPAAAANQQQAELVPASNVATPDPTPTAAARQTSPEASAQEKLKVFVEQEGYNWEVFSLWLDGTGNLPEGADWKSFSDIPDEFAKRFLRARDGLKKGLAGAKGAMTHE